VPYVSTVDLDLPYLDDRLHLQPAGHKIFGDAVAARIAALS
jgi:acyl-CoA thioesterase I